MNSNSIKIALFSFAVGLCNLANEAFAININGKQYQEYTVKKGETLFGICKKFNTSVSEMEKVNPSLKNGLKSDVKIYVPELASAASKPGQSGSTSSTSGSAPVRQLVEHKVQPGETLTSIAKKYNTSIGDLNARNETVLKNGLKSGSVLKVYENSALKNAVAPAKKETASTSTTASKTTSKQKTAPAANIPDKYTVKKGETLYAICKRFGCTVNAVEELNPVLKKRSIYEGETLIMPNGKNKPAPKDQQSGVTVHEIKKGETLYGIANDYQVKPGDIERLNPGVKKDGLKAGKPLIMPSTSKYLADKNSSQDFRVHQVQKDETVFSISKKFGISTNDVEDNNNVKHGVKVGQLLALPPSAMNKEKTGVASYYRQNATAAEPKHSNVAHTVRKGETMFSICQTYKVTENELLNINPELKDGLKADKIIFIPRSDDKKAAAWSSNYLVSTQGNNKVNVAILLPFNSEDGSIDNNTDKFLEFYQGALLAIKKLKERNIWVNVYTYNSGKSERDIKAILAKEEMQHMDFMIGPAYKAQFPAMSEFAISHNVKMVVPFSSRTEEMKSNPNIFLVNAPKNKVAEETAKHIVSEFKDKNVVVVKFKTEKNNDKQEIADSIAFRLRRTGTPVKEIEYTNADNMKNAMKEDVENIVITTSTDQVALTQLIPTINSMLVQKFEVNIFGYSDWTKYQTISNDLFVAETYFSSVYDIDFKQPKVKEFISDFRKYYGQEPGNTQPMYGALGYDIMFYFGQAVAAFGKNFEVGMQNLDSNIVPTLQSNFKFKKISAEGGYYNSDITISRNNGLEGHVILNKTSETE